MDLIRISAAEAHAKMRDEGFVYVDVRTTDEFFEGRPAGAFNVPLEDDEDGFVKAVEKLFKKSDRLIVGCQVGVRSLRAVRALMGAGFTNVIDQRAGWDGARGPFGEVMEPGWSRLGLPYEIG